MKIAKKVMAAALALSIAGFAAADEWDDFGSDDFGSSSSSESAIAISGSAELTGRVYTDIRDGEDERLDIQDMYTEGRPAARLNFDYSGASSDVAFKLKFDKFSLGDYKEDILDEFTARAYLGNFQIEAGKMKVVWGKGDKVHVIDNFNANDYTDFIMPDYIDRRIAEPMFRLVYSTPSNVKFEGVYTPMMTVDRLASSGIWQPAASAKLTELVEGIMKRNLALKVQSLDGSYGSSLGAVEKIMKASSFTSDDLTGDNIHSLKYGQAGARTTFTLGHFDLGLSYYYGHYKQPSADLSPYINSIKDGITNAVNAYAAANAATIQSTYGTEITTLATNVFGPYYTELAGQTVVDPVTKSEVLLADAAAISEVAGHAAFAQTCANHAEEWYANGTITVTDEFELPSLNYDQLQVFGLEFATVIWKFNIRGEGAYYLTEDTAGDNPWIQNNSVQWVAGFDMDMPWTNMNINVQTQGKYILKSDKIKDAANENDVDWNSDDKYISNKVIVDVTDAYNHESIKIDIKGIFEVETKDFLVIPALTIKAADDFSVTASGMLIKTDNENSEFYNFRRNSYGQLSCKYLF